VRIFRKEPLHRRLAREAQLELAAPPPHDTTPRWGGPGVHGIPRARQWDATAIADAPDASGNEVTFAALPDGTLVVESEDDCTPFAEALEAHIAPPYRGLAVRRDESRWAVAGRLIEVVELPPEVDGDAIDLTVRDGERSLSIDGMPSFAGVPALEQLGAERYDSFVVHAERLDGTLWDVRVVPL
jgi:hypothetical protein